jgi:hypothetical protein
MDVVTSHAENRMACNGRGADIIVAMWRWAVLGTAAACGRVDFGDRTPGDAGGDALATDAPPLPAVACRLDRTPVQHVPANADLAMTATASGFVAAWADATTPGAVIGARFDTSRHAIAIGTIPTIATDVIGGISDVGNLLAFAVASGADTDVWLVPYDLSAAALSGSVQPGVTGRDPFAADEGRTKRVFMSATGPTLQMSYISTAGMLGTTNMYTSASTITALAMDDGPSHMHLVWTESLVSGSRCTASDILIGPTFPNMGSMQILSDDCYSVRNDTGPLPPDGMIIVWTTAAGTVEARYIVSSGNVSAQISTQGRAPRVRFAGTTAWIAWIDERSGEELHVATFDLVTGAVTDTAVPGWMPSGGEAFELVRAGNTALLAILSATSLDLLQLCPP